MSSNLSNLKTLGTIRYRITCFEFLILVVLEFIFSSRICFPFLNVLVLTLSEVTFRHLFLF